MNLKDLSQRSCKGCGEPVMASQAICSVEGATWHHDCWQQVMPGPKGRPPEPKK